jgi:hypothetical protein
MSFLKMRGGKDGQKEVIHAKNQRGFKAKTQGRALEPRYSEGVFDGERDGTGVFMPGV